MFIEVLDDVLNKALKSSDSDHDCAVEALRHLTWSLRKNNHLVFFPSISPSIIEKLRPFLNDSELKMLAYSYSKRQDLKKIREMLRYRAEVSFNHVKGWSESVIKINPGRNNCLELFEECHLLTENIIDAKFYQLFALAYQKRNRIDECVFKTNFYPLQGGGMTTKQVFLFECEKEQHFCLAILDSDKKWPNYKGLGQTAEALVEGYKVLTEKTGIPINSCFYVMQKTNEIENLIPFYVLKIYSNSDQRSFLDRHSSALPWFDIKKGMDYRVLYDNNAYNEWKKEFPTEINWIVIDRIKTNSINRDDYKRQLLKEGLNPIVSPWGSTILEIVLNPDARHKNKYDLKKVEWAKLSPFQQYEWDNIGKLVFSWCCCFTRKVM